MNKSKEAQPRWWDKWNKSGAIGTMEEAKLEALCKKGPLKLDSYGEHYEGPAAGNTILNLGEVVIAEGDGWRTTKPLISVVVKGQPGYHCGEKINIPPKAKTLRQVFGN